MSGGARTVFANERRIPAYIVSRQHENVLNRQSRNVLLTGWTLEGCQPKDNYS
jgi:hypothetical protein